MSPTPHSCCVNLSIQNRFRFADLLPCSSDFLERIGHRLVQLDAGTTTAAAPSGAESAAAAAAADGVARETETERHMSLYPVPDLAHMVPFFPQPGLPSGVVRPPAITKLLSLLPPPDNFTGPFIFTDALIREVLVRDIPPPTVPPNVVSAGEPSGAPEAGSGDGLVGSQRKRKRQQEEEEEEAVDALEAAAAPADDLYRARQRQRVLQVGP